MFIVEPPDASRQDRGLFAPWVLGDSGLPLAFVQPSAWKVVFSEVQLWRLSAPSPTQDGHALLLPALPDHGVARLHKRVPKSSLVTVLSTKSPESGVAEHAASTVRSLCQPMAV